MNYLSTISVVEVFVIMKITESNVMSIFEFNAWNRRKLETVILFRDY